MAAMSALSEYKKFIVVLRFGLNMKIELNLEVFRHLNFRKLGRIIYLNDKSSGIFYLKLTTKLSDVFQSA